MTGLLSLGLALASQSVAAPVAAPTIVQASNLSAANADQNVAHADTDTATNGTTVVSTFSIGQAIDGFGANAMGFSTSTDNGRTWTDGQLPGLTANSTVSPNAAFPRAVDSTVAWDAAHSKWLIPSVGYVTNPGAGPAFLERAIQLNTSTDGTTWGLPTTVLNSNPINADKPWVTCDNTTTSAHYGTCYIAFTERNQPAAQSFSGWVTTSTDGGTTWSAPSALPAAALPLAGMYNMVPVVQPNGTVVIVGTEVNGDNNARLFSTVSSDGGATFSAPIDVATIQLHNNADGSTVRELNKPTVDVDAAGKLTVVWSDCRFSSGACNGGAGTNQLVTSTSTNGTTWSAPAKLNIPGATGNQFGVGLAVRPGTSGATAQLSVVYDSVVACGASKCFNASYATSYDGGTTWSAPFAINSTPMDTTWFAIGPRGADISDYNSVSFLQGAAVTVTPLALSAPAGGTFAQTEYGFSTPVDFLKPAVTPPPATAPDTVITKHPKAKVHLAGHHHKAKVKFKFTSTVAGSTFQCRMGLKPWKACNSGKAVYKVKSGTHKFKVRATANGLTDPTKATFKFQVVRSH